jgi:curved DNA-binding protein CbpA
LQPDFDPFDLLGVDYAATDIEITLAWRQLQRRHHPDVAGPDGLEIARRLNVARDWLLDPELRKRLPRPPSAARSDTPAHKRKEGEPRWAPPPEFDPWTFDFGNRTTGIVEFLRFVSDLPQDVADRVTVAQFHGISDPMTFERFFEPDLARRAGALRHALELYVPKSLPQPARWAAVRFGMSILLEDFLRAEIPDEMANRVVSLWTEEWRSAASLPRYGTRDAYLRSFVGRVRRMPSDELARIAQFSPAFDHSFLPKGADAVGVRLAELDALDETAPEDLRLRRAVGSVAGAISAGHKDHEDQVRWWRSARERGIRGVANRFYAKWWAPW